MMRRESEAIAYTIWRTITHGAPADIDMIEFIADRVEWFGHVEALRFAAHYFGNPSEYCIIGENGITAMFI